MPMLHLKQLHCNETEDNTGSDECELRVSVDFFTSTFRQNMNNDQDWHIDVRLPFSRRAKVQLWDLDAGSWWDCHDHLGTAVIRPTPVDGAQVTFNQDGSDYVLDYDVLS